MCGIAGVFGSCDNLQVEVEYCYNRIKHRGPDGFGCAVDLGVRRSTDFSIHKILEDLPQQAEFVGIHTRLSIVDLSNNSLQPRLLNSNKVMLFNGEIYNFKSLAQKYNLQRESNSDTQVLEQLLEVLPLSDVVNELRGMFAIVIYDSVKKELSMARDRFGIKPLYYKRDGSCVRFASEIKALRGYNKAGFRKLNAQKFLLNGVTDDSPETLFSKVFSIAPGAILTFDSSGALVSERVYYDISVERKPGELERLYNRSLSEHLNSDADLAFMLSGGVDSSLNVLSSKKLFPERDVIVFSGITSDVNNDEKKWAESVAQLISADQTFVDLDCASIQEIDDAIYFLDEPFVSLTVVGQSNIFRAAASKKIKVLLSGQGADEVFAGYHNFIGPYLYEIYKERKVGEFFKAVLSLSNSTTLSVSGIILRFFQTYMNFIYFGRKILGLIYFFRASRLFKYSDVLRIGSIYTNSVSVRDHSIAQIKHNNLPMLLRYEDRNSMRHSVESRVPFLDHNLVEGVISLDRAALFSNNQLKGGMKRAFVEVLPPFLKRRKDKVGFVSDMSWVDQNIKEIRDFIFENRKCLEHLLNLDRLNSLFLNVPKYRVLIWRIYCFTRWIKVHNVCFDL